MVLSYRRCHCYSTEKVMGGQSQNCNASAFPSSHCCSIARSRALGDSCSTLVILPHRSWSFRVASGPSSSFFVFAVVVVVVVVVVVIVARSCVLLLLFSIGLRVPPVETRLTVYCWLQLMHTQLCRSATWPVICESFFCSTFNC